MRTHCTRLRAALVLLLVGSGLLFAIGSTIERHQHHNEQPAATAGNGESGESGGESGAEGGAGHVEKSHGEAGVKILGVNTESLALTIVAVVLAARSVFEKSRKREHSIRERKVVTSTGTWVRGGATLP
jgi:hypothetical protein